MVEPGYSAGYGTKLDFFVPEAAVQVCVSGQDKGAGDCSFCT